MPFPTACYQSKDDIERKGYQEITTTADLMIFINKYGGSLSIPGTVTLAYCLQPDVVQYLLVDVRDGTKVFYSFEIGQRVKKRIKQLGDYHRQTSESVG